MKIKANSSFLMIKLFMFQKEFRPQKDSLSCHKFWREKAFFSSNIFLSLWYFSILGPFSEIERFFVLIAAMILLLLVWLSWLWVLFLFKIRGFLSDQKEWVNGEMWKKAYYFIVTLFRDISVLIIRKIIFILGFQFIWREPL